MTDALFELPPENLSSLAHRAGAVPEKLSADRARTLRQARRIADGGHPLDAVWPTCRHAETRGLAYSRDDERGRPHTCGSCALRELMGAGNRTVAKCTATHHAGDRDSRTATPRVTGSAASDVRSWWPACVEWERAS